MDTPDQNRFRKMEGCGNSFVVMAIEPAALPEWRDRAERICSKQWGIGSDGLLLVLPSQTHDFRVAMFNPDGSPMGMCGNGIRCVARFLVSDERWPGSGPPIRFDVEGREIVCRLDPRGLVTVDMGEPILEGERIPTRAVGAVMSHQLEVAGRSYTIDAVSMGNPHCIIEVDRLSTEECLTVGPLFERHEFFPQRTNVEFVQVANRREIGVEVWERGVGRTLACGTGICASVVALARRDRVDRRVRVLVPGGEVSVDWDDRTNKVFLTGPAREVAAGSFSPEFLAIKGEERNACAA